jgi:hypothetical protein
LSQQKPSPHPTASLIPPSPARKITLTIHSSLEAVGLIAAITDRLKDHGVSTNVVSGYFHDHVYVPVARAGDAMRILGEMADEAGEGVAESRVSINVNLGLFLVGVGDGVV